MASKKYVGPYQMVMNDLDLKISAYRNLAKNEKDPDDAMFFDDEADDIQNIRNAVKVLDDDNEELYDEKEKLEVIADHVIPNYGDALGQKNEVAIDLCANCTVEELEALEYLMRLKKGVDYRGRLHMPHLDNVNLKALTKPNKKISIVPREVKKVA